MLRNSNTIWIWGVYDLQFFTFDENSWVHMHYAAMRKSNKIPHSSRGRSGISNSVRWMPNSDSYFLSQEICFIRTLRLSLKSFRFSHLRAKNGTVSHPPPHKFVDFHSAATPILTECFDLVNMSRLNENYKICNDMYLILEQKRKFTWKRSKFQYVICKY